MSAAGNRKWYNDLQNFHFLYHNVPTFRCVDANINKFFLWHFRHNRENIIWKANYWLLFDYHFFLWDDISFFEHPAFEMVLFQIKSFISLLPLPKPVQVFAHPHSPKPVRFPAGQSECFHPAKPSFCPSAVTAGITHYTLQAKPCAKGVPFGNPILWSCVATLPPKCKIRRHRPAHPRCWSMPPICLYGRLLYRPYKPF